MTADRPLLRLSHHHEDADTDADEQAATTPAIIPTMIPPPTIPTKIPPAMSVGSTNSPFLWYNINQLRKMYSWCSVKSHGDHWDHWSQESGGHVSGWALGAINTLHVDLDIVHGHTEVDWCDLVVHASEHLVLFSSSLVGHNDIDTAHFAELWSATLACVRALCDTWADFHAGSIHSVLEEFVELNSLFEHLSITVL